MRPTKLVIKAFGSYAKETVVDFELLNGGLYLIVGKTGAGKTTIFDAISFALFGKASGSERDPRMLHSDFAGMDEDTVVRLDFIHQGKSYHVERTIHFPKKRGTNEYRPPEISAFISGEDMTPVEKSEKVTNRCEELLGMNGDQFRRIVMLAQGEFREFMRSNSDKKNEILGKLFDSSEYVRYQNLLNDLRKDLDDMNREQQDIIDRTLTNQFVLPEGDDSEKYHKGNPHLAENLQELINRERATLDDLIAQSEVIATQIDKLNTQIGAALTNNALLNELKSKRAHLAELTLKQAEMTDKEEKYALAEKAQRRIRPVDSEVKKAKKDLEDTNNILIRQRALLVQQTQDVSIAEKTVADDKSDEELINALRTEAKLLRDSIPSYSALTEKETALQRGTETLTEQRIELQNISSRKELLEKELDGIISEAEKLQGCETAVSDAKNKGVMLRERYKAVAPEKDGGSAESVSEKVLSATRDEEALRQEEIDLADQIKTALSKESIYHSLYQRFIGGQVGLIAQEMEKELIDRGETICPVCNTSFRREDSHRFASRSENIPSENDVRIAEKNWRDADSKRQKKDSSVKGKRSALKEKRLGILSRMRELGYDCTDWSTLIAPGYLDFICEERKRELDLIITEYRNAQKKYERYLSLRASEKQKRIEQTGLAESYDKKSKELQTTELNTTRLKAEIEQDKKQLKYKNAEEATGRLNGLIWQINDLQARLDEHQTALNNAREALRSTEGGITQLNDSLPSKERAYADSVSRLSDELEKNGFGSYEDYLSALAVIGSDNPEDWLTEMKKSVDQYKADILNTGTQIKELEEHTKGKSEISLDQLNRKLENAKAGQRNSSEAKSRQEALLNGHMVVLRTVSDAQKEIAKTESACGRIKKLADLAVGTSGEGGKLSFERYVMSSIFREVLEMANRRLNIMTGGRFELIHIMDAGRNNASAGLEMEVLDVATGRQRPSSTVSGGEGFMVSLALALGLSDVVQNHAGGQKLDTLFIDEGFGTLDDGKLDNVIQVLHQLTEGNRLVGIISHVDKLEESIPQKLRVSGGEHGSSLCFELS